MKTTILLIAVVSGLNNCGGKAGDVTMKQSYETVEECEKMAKTLLTLDHIKEVRCDRYTEFDK